MPITVNQGAGTDMVNLSPTANNLDAIQGNVTVNAGSGNDSLNEFDQNDANNDTYTVTSAATTRTGSALVTYGIIQQVVINGGSGNVIYNLESSAAATPVTLNAGAGNNTFNLSPTGQNLNNIQGALALNAAGGTNTLNEFDLNDAANDTYTITSSTTTRTGSALVTYNSMQGVVINGGGGNVTYNVQNTAATTPVTIRGGNGSNTLVGSASPNTWSITGSNAGTLTGDVIGGAVTFTAVANLTGGADTDTFIFADGQGLSGAINGDGGSNTLDFSAYSTTVVVDLQTSTATGVGGSVSNIQNVIGGTGGGSGIYNILVGNGGNILTGGNGRRNLLIAGGSASTLRGGNDDDILIGGTIAYDTEAGLTSLMAIMNYWSGTADDYATRVNNLLTGNGVPLLDATKVTNNGGGNTLIGNNGGAAELNLFYGLDPTMETTDYNPAIGELFINC